MDLKDINFNTAMSDATEAAEAEVASLLGEYGALLLGNLQEATAGDPFKLATTLSAMVDSMKKGNLPSLAQQPVKTTAGELAAGPSTNSGDTNDDALRLGQKLLEASNGNVQAAEKRLTFLDNLKENGLFLYIQHLDHAIRSGAEAVVTGKDGNLRLKSEEAIRQERAISKGVELAFNDLVAAVHGDNVQRTAKDLNTTMDEARDALNKLKSRTVATGGTPVDLTQVANQVAKAARVKRDNGETNEKLIERTLELIAEEWEKFQYLARHNNVSVDKTDSPIKVLKAVYNGTKVGKLNPRGTTTMKLLGNN